MTDSESLSLREFRKEDLLHFHRHRSDPEAVRMAAFTAADPPERTTFEARWEVNLAAPGNFHRTIVVGDRIAGYVAVFPQGAERETTFWIGREFWGQGIATRALAGMLEMFGHRPILARAAADNIGSVRVLQKCGFRITGRDRGFAPARRMEIEEILLRLDPDPGKEPAAR